MIRFIFQYCLIFVLLILAQVLIFNHILLFDIALPLVFIYLIIKLPISMNLNWLFTFSFLLGLIVDIFSDTPGVNALGCTLLAALKRPVFYAYIPRDDRTKTIEPSISTLGLRVYSKYLLSLVSIYCFIVFTIEYFNFADVRDLVIMSVSSSLLTFVLLLGIDSLMFSKAVD